MNSLISLLLGVLFAVGLVISGMINPEKVIGFLDVFGNWDHSLAFVMGGAVGLQFILLPIIFLKKPVFSKVFYLPKKNDLEPSLIIGSALFGIGWGIAGVCPGPAIVNIARFDSQSIVFMIVMLIGMFLHSILKRKLS